MLYYQDYVDSLIRCAGGPLQLQGGGTMLGHPSVDWHNWNTDEPVRNRLLAWAQSDRFNSKKYEEVVGLVSQGDTQFCKSLRLQMWNNEYQELNLGYDYYAPKCWFYRLSTAEMAQAKYAYNKAVEIIDWVYKIMRARDVLKSKWFLGLLSLYFGVPDSGEKELSEDPERANRVHQAALRTIERVWEGLVINRRTVVLCRGDKKNGEAASAASRKYPVNKGAMILLHDPFFTHDTETQGATIVHEASHLFALTEDRKSTDGKDAYGRTRCVQLSPFEASWNADSYALFAGDVHLAVTQRMYYPELYNAVSTRNERDDLGQFTLPKLKTRK